MIILNKNDVQFILSLPKLTSDLYAVLTLLTEKGGELNEDIADELRDFCTDCLDEFGLDENYEPTKDGEKLEGLIDKLFIG